MKTNHMNIKLKTFLRWLGILPVFVGIILATHYICYFSYRFWGDEHSWAVEYFSPLTSALIGGIASMIYAAKVAPNYKSVVTLILLIIMSLLNTLYIYDDFNSKNYFHLFCFVIYEIGFYFGYQVSKMEEVLAKKNTQFDDNTNPNSYLTIDSETLTQEENNSTLNYQLENILDNESAKTITPKQQSSMTTLLLKIEQEAKVNSLKNQPSQEISENEVRAAAEKTMQPTLLPIEKKYEDYRQKRSEEGKKAVAEMLKQPYSLQEAVANLTKLREERLNNK